MCAPEHDKIMDVIKQITNSNWELAMKLIYQCKNLGVVK